jgi:haloacid dehalogenase-like hydrolase
MYPTPAGADSKLSFPVVSLEGAGQISSTRLLISSGLKLPLQAIPNKGALLVLPLSIDKASGLRAALVELRLQPKEVVGIGDAENDFVFLRMCGCSVAVANAIPELKQQVQLVTQGRNGAGVEELIQKLLASELVSGARSPALRP